MCNRTKEYIDKMFLKINADVSKIIENSSTAEIATQQIMETVSNKITVAIQGYMIDIYSELSKATLLEPIFQKPENVTAARLTGCKNFSRIRRIGEYEVEALDWGLTFQTEEAVAAEHAYIGIRAHQFYPARGSANEFTCEWGDTLCQPFEWDVLLRPVENVGAAGDKENALEREVIWWKVDYKQSDSLNQYQRGDRVRLGIAPGDIMLLKEG